MRPATASLNVMLKFNEWTPDSKSGEVDGKDSGGDDASRGVELFSSNPTVAYDRAATAFSVLRANEGLGETGDAVRQGNSSECVRRSNGRRRDSCHERVWISTKTSHGWN